MKKQTQKMYDIAITKLKNNGFTISGELFNRLHRNERFIKLTIGLGQQTALPLEINLVVYILCLNLI